MECEDKIDIYEYNLQEIPLESLKSLLSLMSGCSACPGCESEVKMLERKIAEIEGKR